MEEEQFLPPSNKMHTPVKLMLCLDMPWVVFFCKSVLLVTFVFACCLFLAVLGVCVCVFMLLSIARFVRRLSEGKMDWAWRALGTFSKQSSGWVFRLLWLALGAKSRALCEWTDGWKLLGAEILGSGSDPHWAQGIKRLLVIYSAEVVVA